MAYGQRIRAIDWADTDMRIIGGKWRSRRLIRPATEGTRPMPDRVKEAVFDILGNHYGCPGAIPALRVADVFAGSGSMGFEAISRGAASCRFFERDRVALDALNANIRALGAGGASAVSVGNAWTGAVSHTDGEPFELILLDPPYRDSADVSASGRVREYLCRLNEREDNRPLVVLHHEAKRRFDPDIHDSWRVFDERRFGRNRVTFYCR